MLRRRAATPPRVWRQQVAGRGYAAGFGGVSNDCFLFCTASFQPCGDLSGDQLAAEKIGGFRRRCLAGIARYRGPDLFSPRDLATPLAVLITSGMPASPLPLEL
jgi:8-oxo-dGTP diphosphatase